MKFLTLKKYTFGKGLDKSYDTKIYDFPPLNQNYSLKLQAFNKLEDAALAAQAYVDTRSVISAFTDLVPVSSSTQEQEAEKLKNTLREAVLDPYNLTPDGWIDRNGTIYDSIDSDPTLRPANLTYLSVTATVRLGDYEPKLSYLEPLVYSYALPLPQNTVPVPISVPDTEDLPATVAVNPPLTPLSPAARAIQTIRRTVGTALDAATRAFLLSPAAANPDNDNAPPNEAPEAPDTPLVPDARHRLRFGGATDIETPFVTAFSAAATLASLRTCSHDRNTGPITKTYIGPVNLLQCPATYVSIFPRPTPHQLENSGSTIIRGCPILAKSRLNDQLSHAELDYTKASLKKAYVGLPCAMTKGPTGDLKDTIKNIKSLYFDVTGRDKSDNAAHTPTQLYDKIRDIAATLPEGSEHFWHLNLYSFYRDCLPEDINNLLDVHEDIADQTSNANGKFNIRNIATRQEQLDALEDFQLIAQNVYDTQLYNVRLLHDTSKLANHSSFEQEPPTSLKTPPVSYKAPFPQKPNRQHQTTKHHHYGASQAERVLAEYKGPNLSEESIADDITDPMFDPLFQTKCPEWFTGCTKCYCKPPFCFGGRKCSHRPRATEEDMKEFNHRFRKNKDPNGPRYLKRNLVALRQYYPNMPPAPLEVPPPLQSQHQQLPPAPPFQQARPPAAATVPVASAATTPSRPSNLPSWMVPEVNQRIQDQFQHLVDSAALNSRVADRNRPRDNETPDATNRARHERHRAK